jgi:formylglycine-generating enzyme required for sulfatase activity
MRWKIDPDASRCGPRRALVPVGEGRDLCVDAYEYPNDPAQPPRTSVNWEDASSLCAQRGRRLCTRDELQAACQGPEEWAFPYGRTYVPGWCQVVEGKIGRGVGKPACRSWWGAYHLVGNAWEWTSTPTGTTYFTFGGTYENGPDVRCGKTSRSFFRQNRYEAVGFRCCEDLPQGK